jgi:hypothetical protein
MNNNGGLITIGGYGDDPNDSNDPEVDVNQDDELYEIGSYVSSGDTQLIIYTENPSNNDNIFFAGFYFEDTVASIAAHSFTLLPVTEQVYIPTFHMVTATIVDENNVPIVGTQVDFELLSSSVNYGNTYSASTNALGVAEWNMNSNIGGIDHVMATAILNGSPTTRVAHVHWIANQPPIAQCCPNVLKFDLDKDCQHPITVADINDGSYDPDKDDQVTIEIDTEHIYVYGPNNVKLTITDQHGAYACCYSKVYLMEPVCAVVFPDDVCLPCETDPVPAVTGTPIVPIDEYAFPTKPAAANKPTYTDYIIESKCLTTIYRTWTVVLKCGTVLTQIQTITINCCDDVEAPLSPLSSDTSITSASNDYEDVTSESFSSWAEDFNIIVG